MLFGILFEQRRVLALVVGVIVVAGLTSASVMPRMEDPELTQRAGLITTALPGATASRVESLVADNLIEALREIEEIKEIRSASRPSISAISVVLKDEIYEVDEVWSRVRDELEEIEPDLPIEADAPDLAVLQTTAFSRIVALAWDTDSELSYNVLARVARDLKDRIRDIPGTDVVEDFGKPEEELLVEVDSEQLRAFGLTASDVARQIRSSDSKVSAGLVRGSRSDVLLEVAGELDSLARIGAISLRSAETGESLQLRDIARIERSIVTPPESLALVNGNRGVLIGAIVESDSQIDAWSQRFDLAIDEFSAGLPRGLRLERVFDQEVYVTKRLRELLVNLMFTCLAIMAVVLLMLGWRSALVVGAALPLTSCLVLMGLRLLEIPLHQMSLTGLIISLGLLIDNAIVAADEVQHRLKSGASGLVAVRGACSELLLPLLGSTITTALSFAPIAMIPGPSGEFVGSIAIAVILSIGCSLAVSLTIVPTVTAIFVPAHDGEGTAGSWTYGLRAQGLARLYHGFLRGMFRVPALGVLLGLVFPICGFLVAPKMKEQFFPPAERDQFHIEVELGAEASITETARTAMQVEGLVDDMPEITRIDWVIGRNAPSFYYNLVSRTRNSPRYAQAIVQLTDRERTTEIINQIQRQLDSRITNAQCRVRQLEQGPPFNAPIEVRLFGPNQDELFELGERVRTRLSGDALVTGTQADLSDSMPKLVYEVSEQEAQLAGLELRQIAEQLNLTLEGAVGGSIIEGTEELKTRVRLTNQRRDSLDEIGSVDLLETSAGLGQATSLPVDAIGEGKLVPQLSLISRFNGQTMNEVRGYTLAGVLPSTVLKPFQEEIADGRFELPEGYRIEFGGESSKRDEAVAALWARIGMLVVLMVAALVISLQSFRAATIIAAVAGLSFGLGFLSVWSFGFPRGFTTIVGTMGLIGIAINDSIVVLAALRRNPLVSAGDRIATADVVVRETRHVLATTFTTIAGFLPLFLSGGGFWPPLAVSIAGGVLGATLLALITVPSAHLLLQGLFRRSAMPGKQPVPAISRSSALSSIPIRRNRSQRGLTMTNSTAWLFPGQGSQQIGMGAALKTVGEHLESAFDLAEEFSGLEIRRCVERGPEDQLTNTAHAQPAIIAVSVAYVDFLHEHGLKAGAVSGHSLGEFAALYAAGVLSAKDTIRLAASRGQLMAESAQGTMTAVKSVPASEIDELIARTESDTLVAANFNSPEQTVVSGDLASVERFEQLLGEAGHRFVRLNVSGAWHSPLVADAAAKFEAILDSATWSEPTAAVFLGAIGRRAEDLQEIRSVMARQIVSPVHWHETMNSMIAAGVDDFVEVGPGKVLRGLMRKAVSAKIQYDIRGVDNKRFVNQTAERGRINS